MKFIEPKAERLWKRIALGHLAGGDVTVFMAVPTIYSRLIDFYDSESAEKQSYYSEAIRTLRLMVSGSAALPTSVLKRWNQISGHILLERWGMTELGMGLSNPLHPMSSRVPGCVGNPMPSVNVRLLNPETGIPFDFHTGTPGELCVSGPVVFKEYWNNPKATREQFDSEGWFKTGDLAVFDLEYKSFRILGRLSQDIFKSSGYKISALEIERELLENLDIKECAVVGIADEKRGERLVAAVVARSGKTIDEIELKRWLSGRIAQYKIPSSFLSVDCLPRNAMGKVSKKELKHIICSHENQN